MPTSGPRRLRSTSMARAFSGETYTTRHPAGSGYSSWSIAARNAARVLPEPVGARTRVLWPDAIAGQASSCARVGAAEELSNHSCVGGWKVARAPLPIKERVLARAIDPRPRGAGRSALHSEPPRLP